jgi:hypothetical protein
LKDFTTEKRERREKIEEEIKIFLLSYSFFSLRPLFSVVKSSS